MPDLITHVAVSHLIKRPFELRYTEKQMVPFRILFYLGIVLPDILTRPWYILFPVTEDWTVFFHTPLGMLLIISLISLFLEPSLRRKAFINLSAGVGFHFLLDALQKQVTGNNYWLFPFSWKNFGYGIMWADEFMDLIPVWIGLVVLMEFGVYFLRKRNKSILR